MKIKRFIDKNNKLIMYVIFIIIFILLVIKSLNSYYEEEEQKKLANITQNNTTNGTTMNNVTSNTNTSNNTQNEETSIPSNDTIKGTMEKFVNYCNNKEIKEAYEMLTDECKNAMYKTESEFENTYIKNIFNEKKEYSMLIWSNDGNLTTCQINFFGDMLSTGNENNRTQEYYTFVKNNGTYKININNYIYGENKNIKYEKNGICVQIKSVNVYDSYEQYEISITNNTSNEICLTGNTYRKNIYLKNSSGTTYSSLNSKFDTEEITIKPGNTKNYTVNFNKIYDANNKTTTMVFSDVILNYEEYMKSENKIEYSNRTSIEIKY